VFSKLKAMLKDYFVAEPPPDGDYVFYPNEFGCYPYFSVSRATDELLKDEADQDAVK